VSIYLDKKNNFSSSIARVSHKNIINHIIVIIARRVIFGQSHVSKILYKIENRQYLIDTVAKTVHVCEI